MKRMFLLFSHQLKPEQESEAASKWGVDSFVPLDAHLKALFSQVPADLEDITAFSLPFMEWLQAHQPTTDDLILIQGEYGLSFYLVSFCLAQHWQVVHTTMVRHIVSDDGQQITRQIAPQMFRIYQSFNTH